MGIRDKYKKKDGEYIKELKSLYKPAIIISIENVGRSKIKDHFIYDVYFLDNSKERNVPVIAQDVSQALAKLESYVSLGIPNEVLKFLLGNERTTE